MRKVDIPCHAYAPVALTSSKGYTWHPKCSLEICHEGDHEAYAKHDLDGKRFHTWSAETNRGAREALLQLAQELADL